MSGSLVTAAMMNAAIREGLGVMSTGDWSGHMTTGGFVTTDDAPAAISSPPSHAWVSTGLGPGFYQPSGIGVATAASVAASVATEPPPYVEPADGPRQVAVGRKIGTAA